MNEMRADGFNRYPIVLFLILANGISVGAALLGYTQSLVPPTMVQTFFGYLAKFGPSLGAIATVLLLGGMSGCRSLLSPLTYWRISWTWCLLIVFGPVVLWVALYGVAAVTTAEAGSAHWWQVCWYAPFFLKRLFLGGGLGEEIGWRGFMLPLLQKRWGPIRASLVVGLCWGLWHAPAFAFAGTGKTGGIANLVLFTVLCIVLSVYFTWVYNGIGGSLLWMACFHAFVSAGMDSAEVLFPDFEGTLWFGLALLFLALPLTWVTKLGLPAPVPVSDNLSLKVS